MNPTHQKVTGEVTRLLAAVALADSTFPASADLPRVAPIPHNHLGHLVLLDYQSLAATLWGIVAEIQRSIRRNPRYVIAPVVGVLAGIVVLVATFKLFEWVSIPVALVCGLGLYKALLPDVEQIIADARARAMEELLRGQLPAAAETFQSKHFGGLVNWGNGELGADRSPVLVITEDNNPFPGFGRLQARQLFVCRPEKEKGTPDPSPRSLDSAIREALSEMGRGAGIACVSSGRAILLDGRTLRKSSPWLRRRGSADRPPLFLEPHEVGGVQEIDKEASVRVYTCIQAVVPEYMMCVHFFVRTFPAGNSAACEVCVSTLGPPSAGWNYIRSRLSQHEREKKQRELAREQGQEKQGERRSALGARLHYIRQLLDFSGDSFKSTRRHSDVLKLDPFDRESLAHEEEQIEKIAKTREMWAGIFSELINWRERNSLTFTTDFFGNTESRAVVQTMYDRICRAVLERLEELGYDISDYKDDKGKFSINASQIAQLVVGERVYMEKKAEGEAGGAKDAGSGEKA